MSSGKKNFSSIAILIIIGVQFSIFNVAAQKSYTQYVNPFIGTGGHGHTFPGATVPFGMVQLSPDTRVDGSWDGCSGYHYSDSIIYGFSHTHLSGTGCSDYGDIMLMPTTGEPTFDNKKYSSRFSHKKEKASAGFYSVHLDDDNIDVELTATTRVGVHKYIFHSDGNANVILDLTHRDKLLDGEIKILSNSSIEVFRKSEAWAKDQRIYAYIVFSKPFINSKVEANAKAYFRFDVKKSEELYVKVSLSAVDYEGAQNNMETELHHWDFEKVKSDADILWNDELSKIEVTDEDKNKLTIFYTALYHCMIQPNIYSDVDGRYRGRDMQIHTAEGFNYYTVFSLWDTFRAWHPLMTIIDEKRTVDYIKTFLAQYEQGGLLPVWELSSNETECMIGYHSISVIADAMTKDIKGFDYEEAFAAAKKSAESRSRYGLGIYADKGFLEAEDENESVSKTLEYAYDDWCIAQMAKLLGNQEDYNIYTKRSQSWRNLLDVETGFMRPRSNGGWYKPFDPYEVNNNYTEANSWQYSFFVPHQMQDLIGYAFGFDGFEKKLDDLFSTSSKTSGREQSDITGLIGQYAQGNEPSHHMAYLYNYINKPYKTQEIIHHIVSDFYKNDPDGLIGNEDCGQMSAWYVMSAMGIYAVCPGNMQYVIGTPLFNHIKIKTGNGKTISINTTKESANSFYVSKILDDETNYSRWFITHSRMKRGGKFDFYLTDKKPDDASWELPSSDVAEPDDLATYVIPTPLINADKQTFKDSLWVNIESDKTRSYTISYHLNNETTERKEPLSFYIKESTTIYAKTISAETGVEHASKESKAVFVKIPHRWSIKLISSYSHQYTAGGDDGLIDGLRGDSNWRKGRWQGYDGKDFECVIDMKETKPVSEISAGFLQDISPWIFMPKKVEYSLSSDGEKFSQPYIVENTVKDSDYTPQVKNFLATLPSKINARYVKVKAYNYGKLPAWHVGAGGDSWIFVDEIDIK